MLLAAGAHAAWNLVLHADDDRVASVAVAGLVSGLALLPFLVMDPPLAVWPAVLVSGVAETVYGLALAGAYARGDLTATYAVGRGTAPLLVTLAAWSVLSQPPTAAAIAGASMLFAGLVLLAIRSGRARMLHATGLAVVVGVAIATYSLADAGAMLDGARPLAYLGAILGLQGILTAGVLRMDVVAPASVAQDRGRDRARERRRLRPGARRLLAGAGGARGDPARGVGVDRAARRSRAAGPAGVDRRRAGGRRRVPGGRLTSAERVQRDRRGRGDVQRVDPLAHRDPDTVVGRIAPSRGDARTLRAEHEREPFRLA